ncbi:OLC1v1024777C1 [Oldenlandia corymbosa var. corymbosa]|uniref:OLC1v1024777C1 n=1 Tax=Oldenlandia corymbosa var. corymbosa TaxID=529605 RepID=A0AAV1C5K2_OLDCO|nr:OLC1v1024777C1 [Oldenlandia corymbosa var. corymbosa]
MKPISIGYGSKLLLQGIPGKGAQGWRTCVSVVGISLARRYRHPSPSVLIPALRTLRNIARGDVCQRQENMVSDIAVFISLIYGVNAFTGASNTEIITAANTYVQQRGFIIGALHLLMEKEDRLGMKDSWGPLKALAVASAINGLGDIILFRFLGYGIAGAAWATMVSQVVAAYMMVEALNNKGYNVFSISIPSVTELTQIVTLAAPVFITMMSKEPLLICCDFRNAFKDTMEILGNTILHLIRVRLQSSALLANWLRKMRTKLEGLVKVFPIFVVGYYFSYLVSTVR